MIKKLFAIFGFSFLLLAFSSPARAEVTCPDGGFVYDPTLPEEWQCCNYQNSPNHISADTADCNTTHCQKQNFPKNADSNTYGGVCRYCNPLVTVRIDGCSGCGCTCNQVCAAAPPEDDDDEDGVCPLPDHETDPCCGGFELNLDVSGSDPSDSIVGASVTFNGSSLQHAHVKNLKERYYGGEEGIGGIWRRLLPPNYLYIQDENERKRVDGESASWGIKAGDNRGVIGSDPYLFQLNEATNFLGSALMPPIQERAQSYLRNGDEEACATTPININLADVLAQTPDLINPEAAVLAAGDEDLCHDPLPGPKHSACVAQNSVDIGLGTAVGGIFRGIKIQPSFSFLKNIFSKTLGAENGPGGFFRIFDLPGDEHESLDGEVGDASFTINISIGPFTIPVRRISLKNAEGKGGVWNTGTEAKADGGIKQKLSVPQAENGAALLRQDYGEPSVVLASTKTPLDNYAPLGPLTPLNPSFAEKLGRTLGTWLGKLITL